MHQNTPPETVDVLHPTIKHPYSESWDWQNANKRDWKDTARKQTTEAIVDAIENNRKSLIDALPAMGKSYGATKAAAITGEPVTIATGRGHEEQYQQYVEWCEEHGLSYAVAPNFHDDCDTMNGEVGSDETRAQLLDKYSRGATPQAIHKHEEMPCENTQGMRCGYKVAWEALEPEETDVIIAHYNHLHVESLVSGRNILIDEFPSAFETGLHGKSLLYSVNQWLQSQDQIDIDDWNDLRTFGADISLDYDEDEWIANRLDEFGELEDDTELVFADDHYYTGAPEFVYTYLAGERHQTGWVQARLPNEQRGVYNTNTNEFYVLSAPDFEYASSIVGLDGTPSKMMWNTMLGEALEYTQILNDDERRKYVEDGMNMRILRTTDAIKPYNNADNIYVQEDAALFDAVRDRHPDREIGLIGNLTALQEYRKHDVVDYRDDGGVQAGPVDGVKWYGNILGSNEFKKTRVGIIAGSQHFGDSWVQRWGAYLGIDVNRDGKGKELTYGDAADELLEFMRESKTLQAMFRFGRDGDGAMVYVHTNTLPDWVPVHGYTDTIKTWSAGERGVIEALRDGATGGTNEVAAHDAVTVSERQTRRILKGLAERGVVHREFEGNGYVWDGANLKKLNDHGEVEFVVHDLADLDVTAADITRTTTYTLDVRRMNESVGCDADSLAITSVDVEPDPFASVNTGGPPS